MIEIQGRSTMDHKFLFGRKHDILIILSVGTYTVLCIISNTIYTRGTEHTNIIIVERSRLTDNQQRKNYLQQTLDGKHLNIARVVLTCYKSISYTWF